MKRVVRQEVLRAFRFTLDPTERQLGELARYAGASRWAFNHALAAKVASHRQWREQVDALVEAGTDPLEARKRTKVPLPGRRGTWPRATPGPGPTGEQASVHPGLRRARQSPGHHHGRPRPR
ncbi:helix-turn-helix domain-containing protein [Kitasatospora purpeofusca]|uniref:helix-turn-helix domain-containing protein n=1 Tax=Kitasatospora purpeofusca TaxID=67352 RepID=UPI00366A0382